MPKFILDPCVEDELWGIWSFIAQDNPDAAMRVIEAAYETLRTLAAHPKVGKLRRFPSRRLRDVRSLPIAGFENYLIFYSPIRDGVQVLHVYHGARDIETLFGKK